MHLGGTLVYDFTTTNDRRSCPMSDQELAVEMQYRIQERLGILCGDKEPTAEQIKIAEREAKTSIFQLMLQDDK